MIRAFNMVCENPIEYQAWLVKGKRYFEETWPKHTRELNQFIQGGEISGDGLKKHWFANVHPHVFISHSHQDEALALGLAGYLREMGINPFVDSLVWGDSNALLRKIDEQFCWDLPEKKYFNYDKRNYSTSHVHMMLASALAETIDRSDAVVFLNTPNSIEVSSAEKPGDEVTASPWIYQELVTTKIARESGYKGRALVTTGLEHIFDAAIFEKSIASSLKILHKPPMDHLAHLEPSDLASIKKSGKMGASGIRLIVLSSQRCSIS
ncbi:toll/interleukin-1 receptor domain-containing protein [Xanthomonas nasturtii]|uniref:toll/interleukin-1 receptor domain-containing protein n=1 Tax=Xanthomonas nasturtii TaxID=1843581 RepID=UPI0020130FBA|nr:toll/interleukin-1 receptor domain-containing protein [Xanthomonas nasturtii]MCL1524412.1 toll/interleukin-1 receptor domain-containing protein [Xanthomonas nasturtii]MCL1534496.1 toll/interleukin-1 receptor domain-containing protein [Xanthomonas nasturtii]MCL1544109.1 toll/interleukin-1 receptor domain-containing protein [Xanthomonas nasturtii]